jgi:hypothetical protein
MRPLISLKLLAAAASIKLDVSGCRAIREFKGHTSLRHL